jgi:hypothetical protein
VRARSPGGAAATQIPGREALQLKPFIDLGSPPRHSSSVPKGAESMTVLLIVVGALFLAMIDRAFQWQPDAHR